MLKLNQFYQKDEDHNRWIAIAFPLTVFGIVLAIITPSILLQLCKNFHIELTGLSRITLSIILVQLLFIVPPLLVALFSSKNVKLKDKLMLANWKFEYIKDAIFYELILILPLYAIAAIMYSLSTYVGLDTSSPITSLLSSASSANKSLIFILSVFFVPVIEEIVFRRVIFSFINNLFGVLPSIILTSLVFAVLHGGIVQLIPLIILGIALQLLYLKHKSLYPAILLHIIHNFVTVLIFLFVGIAQ